MPVLMNQASNIIKPLWKMFTRASIIVKASSFTAKFLILPDKIFNPKK